MEKSVKLQRYDRKDYTELVDFPVEIVGRDGVVRRYTFEDSIRLYQRRITFAPIRYQYDGDLVRAEVNHCRSRIDQLRRSYFHRFGWGTPEGHNNNPEEAFGDLAGELAAFLCRVLGVEGRPEIQFEAVVQSGAVAETVLADGPPDGGTLGPSLWFLSGPHVLMAPMAPTQLLMATQTQLPHGFLESRQERGGMLLYFHRFDGPTADAVRDRFFAFIKALERMGKGTGDAERLLAFHHNVDCGFVLTGRGGDHPGFVAKEDGGNQIDLAPTPWDEVIEIVRKGDYDAALARCRDLVREQPWHRNAYVAGAMLAAYLGELAHCEDLALIGSKYFPQDGAILYYLGLSRLRLGRASAEAALREAVEVAPDLVSARALLATHLVQCGRHGEALVVLAGRGAVIPDDRRADAELGMLEQAIRWRMWGVYGGVVLAGCGLLTAVFVEPSVGLGAVVLGLTCAVVGWFFFQRQLDALVARQRFEEISQGLRRLHRRARAVPLIS